MGKQELEGLLAYSMVVKVNCKDLSAILNLKQNYGTTVSATMIYAHKAGIRLFVTGGICGAHKNFEETIDVSADLEELSRAPVAIVCAGIKSILDIPRTLEYLETCGVPVIGFACNEFPAFYTPFSGVQAPLRMNDAEETARCMKTHWDLGLEGGLLIANPLPEEDALNKKHIQDITEEILEKAENNQISGKDITLFVLGRIFKKIRGSSLKTDIALIKNNTQIGAKITKAFQEQKS